MFNVLLTDNKTIQFQELKVKHFKSILKCLLGDDLDYITVFNTIDSVLANLTNIDLKLIKKINFIDYFLLLLNIRSLCIGNSILAETTDNKALKLDINVDKLISNIQEIQYKDILRPTTINNITVYYKIPCITDIINIDFDNTESIYKACIDKIVISDNTLSVFNTDASFLKIFFNKLPAKITTTINQRIQETLTLFNNVNLIKHLKDLDNKQLIFNFNIKNLIVLVKLLFGEDLLSLYDNIFNLAKTANITPVYIENITPGEYYLFVKKLEALNKPQQPQADYDNSFNSYDNELNDIT